MTNYAETRLHIAVADYLRGVNRVGSKEYPTIKPFPDLLLTHPANQGRSPREGHKLRRMGVLAGVPDFICWFPIDPKFGAIELKSPTGSSSPVQKKFRTQFESMGGKYAICKTVEEVRDTLISWGVECKNTACPAPKLTFQQKNKAAMDFWRPS